MKINGVLISEGNRKLGAIPSVSLHPELSCGKGCSSPLLCMRDCYAMKMTQYTSVAPGWRDNCAIWASDWRVYWNAVRQFLAKRKPERFRWHVGGDIPEPIYLDMVLDVAKEFRTTRFRIFTKADKFLPDQHPRIRNLKIGISHWPGMIVRKGLTGYTHSWIVPHLGSKAVREGRLQDPAYRVPVSARRCPGSCEKCDCCWAMRANQHVQFEQH